MPYLCVTVVGRVAEVVGEAAGLPDGVAAGVEAPGGQVNPSSSQPLPARRLSRALTTGA
jgi:hypothetical protein